MFNFLDRIDIKNLKNNLSYILPKDFIGILDTADRERIYHLLFSIYGYDVLYEKSVRLMLLETLSDQEIDSLILEYGLVKRSKKHDNCLSILRLPWRAGAKFIWRMSQIFSIPLEYLPTTSSKNETIELIVPYQPLPNLFQFQQDIVEKIIALFKKSEKKAFLVQLPTGSGKTRTIIEAIVTYYEKSSIGESGESVLWLAHTEELCEQAIDTFKDVWAMKGSNEIKVIRLWGDYSPNIMEIKEAFIVGSIQKLHNLIKSHGKEFELLCKVSRIVVIDEAHKSIADTYREIIRKLYKKDKCYLIGLTATPGRGKESYQENIELGNLYEKNLITSTLLTDDPLTELQQKGILSRVMRISKQTNLDLNITDEEIKLLKLFNEIPYSILKRLANNEYRNNLIVSLIIKEASRGSKCLVFTCTVEHAKKLSMLTGLKGVKSAYVSCEMRKSLRRRTIKEFKNGNIDVIYNYGVLSTGFDAPNIQTVVIARPTNSIVLYSQMIGRGLRGPLLGGTSQVNLIDIKDNYANFGEINEMYKYFDDCWK